MQKWPNVRKNTIRLKKNMSSPIFAQTVLNVLVLVVSHINVSFANLSLYVVSQKQLKEVNVQNTQIALVVVALMEIAMHLHFV